MSRPYDFPSIEAKWQAYWEEHRLFRASEDCGKPKFYCLDMFPYPSGSGLHVGHLEGYTATVIVSRYKRMRGFHVIGGSAWTDRIERDRLFGQEVMRDAGLQTAPTHAFSDYAAALAFLRDDPGEPQMTRA